MGTRATIIFEEDNNKYYLYRGHDGYPDNVLQDIQDVVKLVVNRWSGSEMGSFITLFILKNCSLTQRIPNYEITPCFHGDESYRYFVKYINNEYVYGVIGKSEYSLKSPFVN